MNHVKASECRWFWFFLLNQSHKQTFTSDPVSGLLLSSFIKSREVSTSDLYICCRRGEAGFSSSLAVLLGEQPERRAGRWIQIKRALQIHNESLTAGAALLSRPVCSSVTLYY